MAAGAKKLVIKNLKKKNALPDNYEERSVAKLQKAVIAIQRAERIDTSLEELYQAVENLCSHGKAEQVYANLRDLVEAHVQVLFTPEIQGGPSGRITQFVALKLNVPTQCKVLKVKPNSYFIVNKSFFSTRWTSL